LTASGDVSQNPAVAWYRQVKDTTTQLEDTAQVFLGQRLKCAECHHHPFERWSQQDYYSFAAFFSQVGRKPSSQPGDEVVFAKRTVASATNKKTKQSVKPAGLGATPVSLSADDDARQSLADWMTGSQNRFFARSLVNRYWKHFFNRGLVEPEDDMRETNPATNPELLDALAKSFAASGYDLKQLVRTICNSRTYQLSSVPNEHNRIDKQNFSRYYPKRLTAEVLLDSVNAVTKSESTFAGLPAGTRAVQLPDNSFNAASYFLTVFGRPDMASSCECERSQDASLAQSLHLLNAKDIQEKLSRDGGRAAVLAEDSTRSDDDKLGDLYRLAFSREPNATEISTGKSHIEKIVKAGGDKEVAAKRQAYEDIVWALLNTKEFLFNH
jgi:ribosomal protein S8E